MLDPLMKREISRSLVGCLSTRSTWTTVTQTELFARFRFFFTLTEPASDSPLLFVPNALVISGYTERCPRSDLRKSRWRYEAVTCYVLWVYDIVVNRFLAS